MSDLPLPPADGVAILIGTFSIIPRESTTISKRKPPSQRPERKLDETARAIARAQEDAKAKKAPAEERSAANDTKSKIGGMRNALGPVKAVGPVAGPANNRPKKAGI